MAVKSVGNNTTTALDNGDTFTGAWELNQNDDVLVTCKTDQAATLYCDFSPDGTNVDSTLTYTVTASIFEIHRLVKGHRYFRVRLTNDSGSNQTYLRLDCSYGSFGPLTTPKNLNIGTDADTLLSRVTDARLDYAQGRYSGSTLERKFGSNPNVGTTEEAIWQAGDAYTGFLQAASAVRIKSGGDAADDSGGLGAQTVVVEGLDENFAEASETITTNGISASTATTTTFIRVYRAYVVNVGTYHAANTGTIDIETTGGTLLARIAAGLGQTQMAVYCVPANKTAYITYLHIIVDGTKAAEVELNVAEASDVSTPFAGKRVLADFQGVSGYAPVDFESLISVSEKTDVWVTGVGPSGGAAISAEFGYVLLDN